MNKKIFISYGDNAFKNALQRIGKEARKLEIFDKIILYNPDDLPLCIKTSPLMAFNRLGGYSVWKSYIIHKTLLESSEGDIIVYADAGCTLQKSDEWNRFFCMLKPDSTLLFQYRTDVDYGWKGFVDTSLINRKWMKKSCQNYFSEMFDNEDWLNDNKLWGGAFLVCKGKEKNLMIENWYRTTLLNPELSIDVYGREVSEQDADFIEHRHDQALLSIFAYYYKNKQSIIFLPETAESQKEIAAIVASRIKDVPKLPFKTKIRKVIKFIVGEKCYKKCKKHIKCESQ